MQRKHLLVVFVGAFGCQQLLGIETGEADRTTGVGAGGSASTATGGAPGVGGHSVSVQGVGGQGAGPSAGVGGGGVGGGGGGDPAEDWTSAFVAVYRFENGMLGDNSAGAVANLTQVGGPLSETQLFAEGGGSVSLANMVTLESTAAALAISPNLTIGAWVRDTGSEMAENTVLGKTNFSNSGYRFGRSENNERALRCRAGDGGTTHTAQGTSLKWDMGAWMHVTCAFSASQIRSYVSGFPDVTAVGAQIANASQSFVIGSTDFEGYVDEVFVIDKVLTAQQVRRIYACHIDGSRCRCNGDLYAFCGPAEPDCSGLPDCNAPPP